MLELHFAYNAEPDADKRRAIDYEMMDIHAESLMYVGVLEQPYNSPAAWNTGYTGRLRNYSVPSPPEWPYSVTSSWYLQQ